MTSPYDDNELEPPLRKSFKEKVYDFLTNKNGTLFCTIVVVVLLAATTSCNPWRQDETKEQVQSAVAPTLYLSDSFAALFRYLRADKICYDETMNAFFVSFPNEEDLKDWSGSWLYLPHPTMYYVKSNNTWFVKEIPANQYTKVWPKVDGMQCGKASEYEGK